MRNAAFANWGRRIAPVFDVAREICLVEVESGQVIRKTFKTLPDALPVQKALRLVKLNVGALVCGAISRSLHETLLAWHIRVIPFVAGDLNRVIDAWLSEGPDWDAFAMPGCLGGRGRRRFCGLPHKYSTQYRMNGMRHVSMGRIPLESGRLEQPHVAEHAVECVCPQCGQEEPSQHGLSCGQLRCPGCGTAMVRGFQQRLRKRR